MQLRHAQRQLLSRYSLRYFSVGGRSDVVVTSETRVPPHLKRQRPSASSFGGISIQNVVVPSQAAPQGPRTRQNRQSRSDDSNNKSPGTRYNSRQRRYDGVGASGASSMVGWDDGVVSLSFSNRLQLRQNKQSKQNTEAHPEAQSRQQHSRPEKRPQQMHVRRHREEKEQNAGFQAHRRTSAEKKSPAENRAERTAKANSRAPSMTRSNASSFKIHARSTPTRPTPSTVGTNPTGAVATRTGTTKDAPADRKPRLMALSSTNLNALFKTRDIPITGEVSLPAYASTTARVRRVLERSAGDYSRFLPRRVGVRKDVSRLSPLRTARHALSIQRDLSLDQRRVALHIIDRLAQPRARARI